MRPLRREQSGTEAAMSLIDSLRADAAAVLKDGRAKLVIGYRKRGDHCEPGHWGPHDGMPITTWVDLIDAIATTPTSSPRSSAASRDISDTIRNGPACIST